MTFKKYSTLDGSSLKAWRKALALTQSEAATALGLKLRMIQNYEKGTHKIPRSLALACWALGKGKTDFDGTRPLGLGEPLAMALAGNDVKLRHKKAKKLGLSADTLL